MCEPIASTINKNNNTFFLFYSFCNCKKTMMTIFPPSDLAFKVVVVGESGVGKSSVLIRYVMDEFGDKTNNTIGVDFYIKFCFFLCVSHFLDIFLFFSKNKTKQTNKLKKRDAFVQNQKIKMQIWDTAGIERFQCITRKYYREARCVILMYDVGNIKSLQQIPTHVSIDPHVGFATFFFFFFLIHCICIL